HSLLEGLRWIADLRTKDRRSQGYQENRQRVGTHLIPPLAEYEPIVGLALVRGAPNARTSIPGVKHHSLEISWSSLWLEPEETHRVVVEDVPLLLWAQKRRRLYCIHGGIDCLRPTHLIGAEHQSLA